MRIRARALSLAAALLAAVLPLHSVAQPADGQKIVVSTDIGDDIDDAFALGLLLSSPEFEVLGIASTWGDTALRARLLQRLLANTGHAGIPLAMGVPTRSEIPFSQSRWAGQGKAVDGLPEAADFILAQARRHPGQVTLLALGPLTDVARAIERDPQAFRQLRQVVLMGGSLRAGYGKSDYRPPNPPAPEYNILSDIAAARKLFASGVPIVMLPLDATQVGLEEPQRVALFAHGSAMTDALAQLYYQWRDTDQPWASATPTVFDVVPVAWLLAPSLCPLQPVRIEVDDQGYTRETPGQPNARACLKLDKPALVDFYMRRLLR
ncbi:nucleoside hydrolase [Stenotrophomonas sp. MMGLT7]|uniref:nucleoside hydrolase n=1 Tax=Stenotrophomonas sp. MMGLT7 TaxID=2901227 RepID=UPI001E4417F8|nr:nucleoside hydrolase [Stenotrophomonas sp. MMGLT7]MCD7097510.1 nucleoside hydrolase [Stenotrophomonas sp. MMGLT7]